MNKEQFNEIVNKAIKLGTGIRVSIKMPDLEKCEVIFNPPENVVSKLEYYNKAYDENLKLKTFDAIKIVEVKPAVELNSIII